MVLNYIWLAFFLTAFAVASVRLIFFGDTTVFPISSIQPLLLQRQPLRFHSDLPVFSPSGWAS